MTLAEAGAEAEAEAEAVRRAHALVSPRPRLSASESVDDHLAWIESECTSASRPMPSDSDPVSKSCAFG